MSIEKTITLYTYAELSDSAKETARQWWLEAMDETDYMAVFEDFGTIAEKLGITFKTHEVTLMSGKTRRDPNIWYSIGYCQSDFTGFEGSYAYVKGAAASIKKYAPLDTKLHAIADALQEEQKRYGYKLAATVTYSDYYGLQVEVEAGEREVDDAAYQALKEAFLALSQWLYNAIRAEHEYRAEEEQIADAMEANEYTFREDGTRED